MQILKKVSGHAENGLLAFFTANKDKFRLRQFELIVSGRFILRLQLYPITNIS